MTAVAGIVLAGGRSARMGAAKAALEWHGSTLLRRVAGIVGRAVGGPVVVVRAPGQPLPSLPSGVEVVDDPREGRGPVQGLATGLAAVRGRADVAYVSSTDVPLLHPRLVEVVLGALDDDRDIALPQVGGFPQPLAAAYRVALAEPIEERAASGRLRLTALLDEVRVRRLDAAQLLADPVLAALDPQLDSLRNVNEPAEYDAARARPAPEVVVEGVGAVRAATLAQAAAAAGVSLDDHVAAIGGSAAATRDPEAPLVAGDRIAFRPASPAR